MNNKQLVTFLNEKVNYYNQPSFIEKDPISIPHSFQKKQDIEIAGFFAAIFAWGGRTTIINKATELMSLMDYSPHQFILHHNAANLKKLFAFKHRTFNSDDLFFFIDVLKKIYSSNNSLEDVFFPSGICTVEDGLNHFKSELFKHPHLKRTEKHISSPSQKSACKRLNMFLRWMVRADGKGVDFGIWKSIAAADLIIPLDLHVARVARQLKILTRKQTDWQAAVELTDFLKILDKTDPVKYDFALFSLGAIEKIIDR